MLLLWLALWSVLPAAAGISALHPRLYVRHDEARTGSGLTVSQLRARLQDPAYRRWRVNFGDRGAAAMVEHAARYLEDGSATELAMVRDFLLTHTYNFKEHGIGAFLGGGEMAVAFDWIYAGLTPAERTTVLANLAATAEASQRFLEGGGPDINHNYTYMAVNALTAAGLAMHGEPAPYSAKADAFLAIARHWMEGRGLILDTWNARQGAWAEGSHYTFHETLRNLVLALHAWRSASDTDYFPRFPNAGRFLIAATRPDMTFERTGDTLASRAAASLTVPLTVEMVAAGATDPAEAARLRSFAQDLLAAHGAKAVYPDSGWGMRIFYGARDPLTPSYKTLPLFQRHGPGTDEQISWRNGWSPDSTLITILAGDHYTDHQHFDKGQFLIYNRGGLAVDSGAYDHMYQPGAHANEYAPRTIAHNCLLVYDPDEVMPKGYTNDGGQLVIRGKQHHADWQTYLAHREREGLHTSQVTGYDAQDGRYAWLRVDLQRAYGPKVKSYVRQFVYLPARNLLLIDDRVVSANPDFEKRWLLHTQDKPEVEPNGVRVKHGGEMTVTTLLPAKPDLRIAGGPGFEFVNPFTGRNYPVSDPRVSAPLRESGAWRMEVVSRESRFLHAIGIGKPPDARLVVDGEGHALGVQSGASVILFGLAPNQKVTLIDGSRKRPEAATAQGILIFEATSPRVTVQSRD